MRGYQRDEDHGGQDPRVEPRSSTSEDQCWSSQHPCCSSRRRRESSGGTRPPETARPAQRVSWGGTGPASEGAGILPPGGCRRSYLEALLLWALVLCLAGCSDQVKMPSAAELAAFEQAGFITPVVDMERIEKAKLKTGAYRVVRGDVLELTMPTLLQAGTAAEVQAAQTRSPLLNPCLARVRDNGAIDLPAVGSLMVAGLSLAQIEEKVTEAYKSHVVLHPSVFVRVAEYRTGKVYIAGAVKNPGVYDLPSDQMTLSSLLTKAGGITEAGAALVRVMRSEPAPEAGADLSPVAAEEGSPPALPASSDHPGVGPAQISLTRAQEPAENASTTAEVRRREVEPKPIVLPVVNANVPYRDLALGEGDTVVVQPVQMPMFSVLGLVVKPGNFPYPPGAQYNLTQAIAFAGGLDPVARPNYVTVYRLAADGSVLRAPFRLLKNDKFTEALGTPIRPGDVVAVEDTPRTRTNTAIRDLFRFNAGIYLTGQDFWGNND
jgi:protein involved in polysaccharide export with SLBB domain